MLVAGKSVRTLFYIMSYAQKSYPQIQGINGKYSIADIGCFLTSFCHLEADYGRNIDPLSLNNWFRDTGNFVDIDDGIRDDLGWESITRFDSNTHVSRSVDHGTNRTAGWPNTNQAIVRFYYQSTRTGKMITHFCKVESAANHLILDSWDGTVKKSPYGEPTAWAEYRHDVPAEPDIPRFTITETYPHGKQIRLNKQPTNLWGMNYNLEQMVKSPVEVHNVGEIWTVTNKVHHSNGYDYYRREGQVDGFNVLDCDDYTPPVPYVPPAPPEPIKIAEKYELVTDLLCYGEAQKALAATTPVGELKAGTYYVWGRDKGCINLSTSNMKDHNQWIEERRNVVAAPVIAPVVPPKIIETIKEAAEKLPDPVPQTDNARHTPDELLPINPHWRVTTTLRPDPKTNKATIVLYRATNTHPIKIYDYEDKQPPIILEPYNGGRPVALVQTFNIEHTNGAFSQLGRAKQVADKSWFYGVEFKWLDMLPEEQQPWYEPLFGDMNKDGKRDTSDIATIGMEFIDFGSELFKTSAKVISTLARNKKLKQSTDRFIDGIRSKK